MSTPKYTHKEREGSKHHVFECLNHYEQDTSEDTAKSYEPILERIQVIIIVKCDHEQPIDLDTAYLGYENITYDARDKILAEYAAEKDHVDKVVNFVEASGLKVIEANADAKMVVIEGSVNQINEFFNIDLKHYQLEDEQVLGHEGNYSIPEEIESVVKSVIGLSKLPICRNIPENNSSETDIIEPKIVNGIHGYTGADFAKLYNFPKDFDGSGECIGILALEGGYHKDEMEAYFRDNNISPMPEIIDVPVNATNNPGEKGGQSLADLEVCLDIQVAASAAPGAKIVVYFVQANDASLLFGIKRAVTDRINRPSVISISLGNYEKHYSSELINEYNDTFRLAVRLGITILCSAGNYGATNYNKSSKFKGLSPMLGLNVQFPASSPFVLSVGGTTIEVNDNKIVSEKVWNGEALFIDPWNPTAFPMPLGNMATGGGFSTIFEISPLLSERTHGKHADSWPNFRGIPDVCAAADPMKNGYYVYCDGAKLITGGTSAATPLWAALCVRLFQALGKRFFMTPVLYKMSSLEANDENEKLRLEGLNRVTEGDNIVSNTLGQMGYKAHQDGWSPCTGLGSPNGEKLLQEFRNTPNLISTASDVAEKV